MTNVFHRRALGVWAAGISLGSLIATVGPATPALAATPTSASAIVPTDRGLVRGQVNADHRLFQGIPFARPPVGDLRWKNPRPAKPWAGVRDARAAGPRCAQPGDHGEPGSKNEDCLYLNVTAPRSKKPGLKPVMLWVHGGGYTSGDGAEYQSKRLAAGGDVVVVTVNYRLGVFGFLGLPGLEGAGTFGLADQQAAMKWVRHNAAFFGGDPHNVTLFGESAGGMSTCAQLTSPSAAGLFDKAIVQSGTCSVHWPKDGYFPGIETPPTDAYSPAKDVNEVGTQLAAALKCTKSTLSCLRGKSVDTLLGSELPSNLPAYHTNLLPMEPAKALRVGRFNRVPIINGHTRDEHLAFARSGENMTAVRFRTMIGSSFGTRANEVLARYPLKSFTSPAEAWGTIMTDRVWTCPAMVDSRQLARRTPTYAYEFADRTAPKLLAPPKGSNFNAVHASEIPYLFDIAGINLTTPDHRRLAQSMVAAWTRFAHTSAPGGAGQPAWLPVKADEKAPYVQEFNIGENGIKRLDHGARHQCDFWSHIHTKTTFDELSRTVGLAHTCEDIYKVRNRYPHLVGCPHDRDRSERRLASPAA